MLILAPLGSWWSMWAVKGWLIMTVLGALVVLQRLWKLNYTPSLLQAANQIVLLGWQLWGGGHAIAASLLPFLPRPLSFHPSSNPTSLLFLSLPSTTPLCQASLMALGILQGTEETRALLFRGLYLLGRESP